MLSIGQKIVGLGTVVLIEVVVFLLSPLLAVLGLFVAGPLAFAILTR